MTTKLGTIISFSGSWGSGIAELVLRDEQGQEELVWGENPGIVRALVNCFPEEQIIFPGHLVNPNGFIGKQVTYQVDCFGVIEYIAPAESAELQIETKGI